MSPNYQFGKMPDPGDGRTGLKAGESAELDALVNEALENFRSSVRAWSEAAYSRLRTADTAVRRRSWRLAAGWAMACVLVAGGVTGGLMEQHARQQAAARLAAQKQEALREQQLAAARVRQQNQRLLATVDTDISQEVPSAMEPLAALMEDNGNQ